jgi:hypothetical protein
VRRAHTVDVTGLYVLSEAEGGESGDVADIMESKRLQAEADLLGNYEGEDDDEDDEDNDEEGDYAGMLLVRCDHEGLLFSDLSPHLRHHINSSFHSFAPCRYGKHT